MCVVCARSFHKVLSDDHSVGQKRLKRIFLSCFVCLLQNISIVKLFLLCMELDDADDLISSVFRLFFEIVE